MREPLLLLDGCEGWRPVAVEDSLERQGYYWQDRSWCTKGASTDRLDFAPEMKASDFEDLPAVGYHRVVRGGALHWHQFWTWWPYNPKEYVGRGQHEGDWELVQYGCIDAEGEQPVLATYSQHGGGERRHYWDVELSHGKQGSPLVYVARDSHANYFAPVKTVTDIGDGSGPALKPTWLPFGPWEGWMGQWGHSANSPGALSTRRYWKAPHAWHSQARG